MHECARDYLDRHGALTVMTQATSSPGCRDDALGIYSKPNHASAEDYLSGLRPDEEQLPGKAAHGT